MKRKLYLAIFLFSLSACSFTKPKYQTPFSPEVDFLHLQCENK